MKKELSKSRAITLIALVITIVLLLILAGVTINSLSGENGLLKRATSAVEATKRAEKEQQDQLDYFAYLAENLGQVELYDKTKKVNEPQLVTGMKKIMFEDPSKVEKAKIIKEGDTKFDNENWYSYDDKRWANAQTEDGSMWVWIPRFAYKINSKSEEKVDVKFLIGTSDYYYDDDGSTKKAQRQTKKGEKIDTSKDYTVHPAFTDETSIGFVNGGWDKEIPGIWVAKFEAAYASSNGNKAKVQVSSQNYSQTTSWVDSVELGSAQREDAPARNWLDGIYGDETTAIKYPTFQPLSFSMNYINHNDAFNICRVLTEKNNIYGLGRNTDSHLMKNSEWGAVAYLGQSKYGLDGTDIYINNITLNSGGTKREETDVGKTGVSSVYCVTGVTEGTRNGETKVVQLDDINNSKNGVIVWNEEEGQGASSSGTIYGIYDLSGGLWERTAVFVENGHESLKEYGASIAYEDEQPRTEGNKYITVYESGEDGEMDLHKEGQKNYEANANVYGDAIHETTLGGKDSRNWFDDFCNFVGLDRPFPVRGGRWTDNTLSGLFAFDCHNGGSLFNDGFRPVLIAQ